MLKVEEGALYPALHRMELRGIAQVPMGTSDNNRRAKFYELTAEGQKRLHVESPALGAAIFGGRLRHAGILRLGREQPWAQNLHEFSPSPESALSTSTAFDRDMAD